MTATTSTKLGFVGLGHMGGGMAARLLAAGYEVYGEERAREDAQPLVDQGLRWRDTPRQVAEAADIVLTSIPDDGVLEAIGSGRDGLLRGFGPAEDLGGPEYGEPPRKPGDGWARASARSGHA
jgi:3-hydroxyisobutyrate dehydrogenase-like beta-hydroxyacid dehydrogenase